MFANAACIFNLSIDHLKEAASAINMLLQPLWTALLAGIFGWWLANYFQATKVFFDSKRVAFEKLVGHFAEIFATTSEWARAYAAGQPADHFMQQFDQYVNQTWPLIGQLCIYAPSQLATEFTDFNDELVDLMEKFKNGDKISRKILLLQDEEYVNFREEKIYRRLAKLRKNLVRSVIFPWLNW